VRDAPDLMNPIHWSVDDERCGKRIGTQPDHKVTPF
jgi:hypothetical protein